MRRAFAIVAFAAATAGLPALAQTPVPGLGGVWTLDRSASELSKDIGFNPTWASAAATDRGSSGSGGSTGGSSRGRGGRGGGGGGQSAPPFAARAESYDDSRRLQLLNSDARNPSARLTIVDTPAAVTFTNELGQSRTVHPDGHQESIEIEGVPVAVTAKRDGDKLVIVYHAEKDRDVRYTYEVDPATPRLMVDIQFLEHGTTGDKARRVYQSGMAGNTTATAADRGSTPPPAGGGAPRPAAPTPEPFDQRPGAELKGLTSIGVLVEDLSATAVSCGLNRDAIEAAIAKQLSAGGFTVRRNSDEDTYVYVNIMTSSMAGGMCVSRYDAFLYTQATARVSYRDQPVLVQVSLMHRGGIGSSAQSAHASAVVRGLEGFIDVFTTQIHDANK
jgi:hypothetical protein